MSTATTGRSDVYHQLLMYHVNIKARTKFSASEHWLLYFFKFIFYIRLTLVPHKNITDFCICKFRNSWYHVSQFNL